MTASSRTPVSYRRSPELDAVLSEARTVALALTAFTGAMLLVAHYYWHAGG